MGTSTDKLTERDLNRALLARQGLLARRRTGVEEAVAGLVGLQAQVPGAPWTALWSRIDGFDPEAASELLESRRLVRMSTLRGTIHLHGAEDALTLRRWCQPVNDRGRYGTAVYRKELTGVTPEALEAAAREVLHLEGPLTNARLGAALAERFPGNAPATLAWAVRDRLPLVQVPPRGLWRRSGATRSTTAEEWLGRGLPESVDVPGLIRRYLAAFGPASVMDAQAWCGLTRLGEVFERLRPELRVFQDAGSGRELFDLPDAPRPDPDTPAPVRFLPDYDNVLLAHKDRARVLDPASWAALAARGNGLRPFVLVDGRLAGGWSWEREKDGAVVLTVELFRSTDPQPVETEAAALLSFLAPDAEERRVRLQGRDELRE
ncbi:winged helix DNA-binding domain-containing protein [Streptacidiphilus monticola]|uniref:Winged helix DNA-binding domain-containing protein n=1 Tax=Streptacidiphilus monticola TaxID=2161674 RepID=A0ABW1FXM0_9ACTN